MSTLDLRAKELNVLTNATFKWAARVRLKNQDGTAFNLTGYTITAPFTPVSGSPSTLDITGRDDANGIFFFGQTAASWGTYQIILDNGSTDRPYIFGTIGTKP